jgi:hypothetical protein
MDLLPEQEEICRRFGVVPLIVRQSDIVGVARNLREEIWPINGLRHPPQAQGDTSGWYLWAGEELSDSPDFFVPLHMSHLAEWNSLVIPYLALPPGWRFKIAPGHEDVWRDTALLEVVGPEDFVEVASGRDMSEAELSFERWLAGADLTRLDVDPDDIRIDLFRVDPPAQSGGRSFVRFLVRRRLLPGTDAKP